MTPQHPVPTSPATPTPPSEPPPPAPPPLGLHEALLLPQADATGLALVRHGQQQRPGGTGFSPAAWVDPPLSDLGRRQATAVGEAFAGEQVDLVVCSSLVRAHETARAIAGHHGLEPLVLPDLREVETFRDLDEGVDPVEVLGKPVWTGVQARFEVQRRWDVVPYGEGSAELRHRVGNAVEGVLALHPDAQVVVVCHGGVINAYLCELLGIQTDMFFMPAHASVARLRRHGDRRALISINDRGHLPGDLLSF